MRCDDVATYIFLRSSNVPCHFLKLSDFSGETLRYMIDRAKVIKADLKAGKRYEPFAGKVLIMVFEKASTRTRVSFETGFYQLGGNVVNLQSQGSQIGRSESIADTARVISRMGDLIMMRTFGQDRLDDMAVHSRVPVINGLTNEYHPCQILTDILTFEEHCGPITGKPVAWVGDANNMAYTWIEAAKLLIRFFADGQGASAAVKATGCFPVRDTVDGADLRNIWAGSDVMTEYAKLTDFLSGYDALTPGWATARTEWWNMLQRVGNGGDVVLETDTLVENANAAAKE